MVCFLTHTEAFGVIILPLGHDDPAACVLHTGAAYSISCRRLRGCRYHGYACSHHTSWHDCWPPSCATRAKKKNNCRCVGEGSGAAICEHCARCVALGIPSHVVGRLLLRLVSASQLNEDHLVQFRARVAGPSRAARKARPGQGGLAQRWAGSWQISPSPQRPRISTAVSPVGSHGLFCFLPPVRTKGPVSRH